MRTIFFLLLFFVCLQSQALAQVIRQPIDLAPGDQYRLMFTTSTTRDATSANIDDYNSFVQSVADAAPEVGSWGLTWKVIASTKEVDAIDNTGTDFELGPGVPIYRVDGVRIADGNIGLWDPFRNALPLADTYAIDERGIALAGDEPNVGVPVFTGTSWVGRATPLEIELAEFVGLGGLDIIDVGSPDIRSIGLRINNAGMDATMPGHFYALSEVITAVPEPQTGVAMFLGVITLAACLRKRHARRISPEFLGRSQQSFRVVALNVPESPGSLFRRPLN